MAWATPAASATGSAPATRVVFFVAVNGNPSFSAAFGVMAPTPLLGTWTRMSCVLPPQAASARQARASRTPVRRIAGAR